jgi:hypothetical protein
MRARALTLTLLAFAIARAQGQRTCGAAPAVVVGSEWEEYLRAVQVAGLIPLEPWSVRGFGPREWNALVPSDTTLPWFKSFIQPRPACIGRLSVRILPARLQLIHNSGFPFGKNDGAVWAGRGVTMAADAGVSASYGPLTATFAPLLFAAQNEAFGLKPTGLAGNGIYADWLNPEFIDLPQRFGSGRYAAFDLGESGARVDASGFAVGVSTAHEFWGPATDHPIILGNNASGFLHLFVGTSRPMRVWRLGRAHGRVLWGKLEQTPYSPLADFGGVRLGSGLAMVFQPAFARGLEVGGARFFHVLQDRFRLDRTELLRPFGALTEFARARQTGGPGTEPDNQLSSLFARYVLPDDGAEFYGEYGREDRSRDMRDFLLMPDHDAAYLLGMRKQWHRAGSIVILRAEVLNSRLTHLAFARLQSPWYLHGPVRQGHTNRGQVLGSAAAYGGGARVLVLERYDKRGRWRVEWERLQLGQNVSQFAPSDLFQNDVAHSVGMSLLRLGRRVDVDVAIAGVYEFNRHFAGDAINLHTAITVRPPSRRHSG